MNKIMVTLLDNMEPINVESDYIYNGIIVPRVTKILSKCIHSDTLMYWANSLGFKHKSYKKTIDAAAEIGHHAHDNIDKFLEDENYTADESSIPYQSYNAYQSFLKWFNTVSNIATVRVIFHEKTLTCKYFGGTLDGLYEINGKIYLVDYKTSNHITFRYILQLAAYRYMLRTELGIEIDGCIILQLAKESISYNEYVLNFDNINHLNYINDCEMAFLSLVFAYYNINKVEDGYNTLDWEVI
jgi:hypothetical protein